MPRKSIQHECLRYAVYHAPRGKPRLLELGNVIQQRYLAPKDQLIGIVGEAGTGKSSVIRGMFPGLELTNEDDGVNVRPVPLMRMYNEGRFTSHTYHIDIRFEQAFVQLYEIADAIKAALKQEKRIIIEHFDVIYPALKINAEVLIGIGEEIIVTRPDVFGPLPEDVRKIIEGTAVYRRMAHSAEDLTSSILEKEYGFKHPLLHRDVKRGFVIEFEEKPENLKLDELENKVKEIIGRCVDINYLDESHIRIGDFDYHCTGPRIHVKNSSEIKNFRLQKNIYFDEISSTYCLVGLVGDVSEDNLRKDELKLF